MGVMNARVLVVDDDKEVQEAVCNMLIDAGYEPSNIETSWNGQQALSFCREKFDLVITDYQMPFKNGLDFVREMMADSSEYAQPKHVVMISGVSPKEMNDVLPVQVKYLSKGRPNEIRDYIQQLEF